MDSFGSNYTLLHNIDLRSCLPARCLRCGLGPHQVRGLKSMFNEMDVDGSNMVSVNELKALRAAYCLCGQ